MKKALWTLALTLVGCASLASISAVASAQIVDQYANSVLGFSSQWSSGSWSAAQTLGVPDTFAYGDIGTAWAPAPANGTLENITLGYLTNVYADGATVRETNGNGFVYQIDVLDLSDVLHTVWTGTDPSAPGAPVDALFTWTRTNYLVKGLKVYTNTNHDLSTWEEIDAVQLHGNLSPAGSAVPEPGTYALLGGLAVPGAMLLRRRRA